MTDSTEIIARHYQTGEGHQVIYSGGVIESVKPAEAPEDTWYGPGIFDPQVNGYAGIDFQKDGLCAEDLHKASSGLKTDGCPRWLLTLITDDFDKTRSVENKAKTFRCIKLLLIFTVLLVALYGVFVNMD